MRFSRSTEAVSKPFGGEIARGKHLFPFRTEPLSLSAPMVLGGQPPGRVGRRRSYLEPPLRAALFRSHMLAAVESATSRGTARESTTLEWVHLLAEEIGGPRPTGPAERRAPELGPPPLRR